MVGWDDLVVGRGWIQGPIAAIDEAPAFFRKSRRASELMFSTPPVYSAGSVPGGISACFAGTRGRSSPTASALPLDPRIGLDVVRGPSKPNATISAITDFTTFST